MRAVRHVLDYVNFPLSYEITDHLCVMDAAVVKYQYCIADVRRLVHHLSEEVLERCLIERYGLEVIVN
jgi:hypothetical protein